MNDDTIIYEAKMFEPSLKGVRPVIVRLTKQDFLNACRDIQLDSDLWLDFKGLIDSLRAIDSGDADPHNPAYPFLRIGEIISSINKFNPYGNGLYQPFVAHARKFGLDT